MKTIKISDPNFLQNSFCCENSIVAKGMPVNGDEVDLLVIPFSEITELRRIKEGEPYIGENVNLAIEVETTEGPQTYIISSYVIVGDFDEWAKESGNSLLIG